jgi:addiction module HigA family antidote
MLMTKRKPATIGKILVEFMKPIGLTQVALASATGMQRKHVNELCNDRRNVTAATALILARVFGNSPDFWLNAQRRSDLWEAMHSPRERKRIERATSDSRGVSLPCDHVSRADEPASVTIASRPCVGRDGRGYAGDLGQKGSGNIFAKGAGRPKSD